ncbi:hypothetical protein [Rhizobium leguminosarum]|uniref:Uncharacterized protein n=1 Tax=Rhizobium leguminosarum TaxID=384 RepID=A0A7W9ZR46_RHILE|nr:hypothetical protein [Rhizobium leguminosarum]MBB6219984.1 hypothetical protein [Rhizobium leguminosarum]
MVYISGANKNRLGTRRFDALFAPGCGQLQQDNGDGMAASAALAGFRLREPRPGPAEFPQAIDQG